MADGVKPTQIKEEFDWFCAIMRRENVRSYLEIGSKYGVSLRMAAACLPVPSRIVSVDIGARPMLINTIGGLCAAGYDAHMIAGDSTSDATVTLANGLGPFDCCFIDANHMTEYVEKDFANYGPMCRMVAFHDVGWRPTEWGTDKIHVPAVWNKIKDRYRHEELCLSPNSHGIGVVWMC